MQVRVLWPLKEEDITEKLCKQCGLCCCSELKPQWGEDKRMMDSLRVMVEKSPNITFFGDGIRIQCSHLRQTTHTENPTWECSIYDNRPQLCEDFNCVAWAKVTNNRTIYDQVLDIVKRLK